MDVGPGASGHDLRLRVTFMRRLGRWFRNQGGFAFTDRQILARWDDLGGPKPFEQWSLRSRRQFFVSKLPGSAALLLVIVASRAWQGSEPGFLLALGAAVMVGAAAGIALAIGPAWRRQRSLYDLWLSRKARAEAKPGTSAIPI